jgi:hypothetical protein
MAHHARVSRVLAATLILLATAALLSSSVVHASPDVFRTITASAQAAIVVDNTYWTTAEQKAADMLQDEVQARTGFTIPVVDHSSFTPQPGITAFLVGRAGSHALIDSLRPGLSLPAEGFHLETAVSGGNPYVVCAGKDNRGALYAAGKCLRKMEYAPAHLTVPVFDETDAPEYPIRGHQLGYTTTSNTYDKWDVPRYEQCIRDLIVFGANCVEMSPPRTNSPGEQGPLMPVHPWQLTQSLCNLCNDYDLNVWMWLHANVNLADPTQRQQLLDDRTALFAACNRIDAVFVPGGDPGSNPPDLFMAFVQDLATALRAYHPQAQVWVSHQGWEIADRDWFYNYLQTVQPTWLNGIVYGPWARDTLANTRAQVPVQYAIRHYPDITHAVRCQYPVPAWDHAFALTLGREPINPRPNAEAQICSLLDEFTSGAISYSEGVNDDINKTIWSARLWDPAVDVWSVLADYNRYFFSSEFGDAMVADLLSLEANWQGAVMTNAGIDTTLANWQAIEASASPSTLASNWRFQQGLFRAYYDAYVKARRIEAAQLEQEACDRLAEARTVGANTAIANALAALARQDTSTVGANLRARIMELGNALNATVGMQLSVPLHGASGAERGAVLDFLGEYLNNRTWLQNELNSLLALADETDKLAGITRILGWEMGGPDGFYDDLGNPTAEPHLIHAKTWDEDPGFVESAQDEFDWNKYLSGRLSWRTQGQTLYETPLQMHFDDLDPTAGYTLRVTYAGRFNTIMTLDADGTPIHGATGATNPPTQYEYPIPQPLTADGQLTLAWQRVSGRGPQVAEVWLVRSEPHIIINDGATHTASPTLALKLWALSPREMQFQYPGSAGWTAWEPFAFSKQINLCGASGTVQVDFRVRFTNMSVSGIYSDTIIMDPVQPPSGLTISINGQAQCTNSPNVTLALAATGAAEMRFRNETGGWSAWEPYGTTKAWALSSARGTKTVGFQARDACGNAAAEVTDQILRPTFDDVLCANSQRPYVEALVREGITGGCGANPPLYCPTATVTRAQMAKFLCIAAGKQPLDRDVPTFADVPKTHWAYGYVERLADAASWPGGAPTGGCRVEGTSKYFCPNNAVTREQMAKFLCLAAGKSPMPSCSGTFADVPSSNTFCPFIERLTDAPSWPGGVAVTSGCACPSSYPPSAKCYCPKSPVTRGQMAVFLVRAFGIPL